MFGFWYLYPDCYRKYRPSSRVKQLKIEATYISTNSHMGSSLMCTCKGFISQEDSKNEKKTLLDLQVDHIIIITKEVAFYPI